MGAGVIPFRGIPVNVMMIATATKAVAEIMDAFA